MRMVSKMVRQRKYFDEPLVRAKISLLRFPNICPVCNDSSTKSTWISATPRNKQWLRPYWNPAFYSSTRKRLGIPAPISKSFQLHVCDDHNESDDGNIRIRGLVMLFTAILSGISIFALIFTGYDISSGRGVHPIASMYLLLLVLSLFLGYIAFKPTALEASVKIIGFDFDLQYVWIQLKDPEYRKRFLEENKSNSEIVNWIIMA
jgi:hypothetical protein